MGDASLPVRIPRLTRIRIKNYRSVADWVDITLPSDAPLVLIGENNAGKSNILRAVSLVLGETWPGSHSPDDHEFFGRSSEGTVISVDLKVAGLTCPKCPTSPVHRITWTYDKDGDKPCQFLFEASRCPHTFVTNDLRGQLGCMTIGVDRDLSRQLSYVSKWTILSKLMRRFHARLIDDVDRTEKLKGFYASLIETFHEVPEFRGFAEALKSATENFGGNMTYGLDIDFSAYDPSNFFRSLRVSPHLDGEPRSYEELGSGQEQVLAMAFSYAYAMAFGGEGLVLAVEEPEAHLHPLAQEWVAAKLRELAAEGVQVVLTTHSPYFVDLSRPGTTAIVRKQGEGQATTVIQLQPPDLVAKLQELGATNVATPENVGPFYENAATNEIKAGLFACACLLVEGPTEQLALEALLTRLGANLVRLGIAIIPVGGVTNLAKWVRYYRAHGIPVYPIFDSDSTHSGKVAAKERVARSDLLRALGIVDADDWTDVVSTPDTITDTFAVFDPDFETVMRARFGAEYAALEETARESLGQAKPLIARYVARNLSDPPEDPEAEPSGWDALRTLAGRCTSLVSRTPE